jgi:hypothetical protein
MTGEGSDGYTPDAKKIEAFEKLSKEIEAAK